MWVLFWEGTASYWLLGDAKYVIGRKAPSDIIVDDDPSISRTHLTIYVGLPHQSSGGGSLIPPITLRDTSKFGVSVAVVTNSSSEVAGKRIESGDWCLDTSIDWRKVSEIRISLGTHGAMFVAKWQTTKVVMCSLSEENAAKVETAVKRCGLQVTELPHAADICACGGELYPNPIVMLALCGAKPIIDILKYFTRLTQRLSPKSPPPDPVSDIEQLFPRVSSQWWEMFGTTQPSSGSLMERSNFVRVSHWRSSVFRGFRFVCFEKSLFDEVSIFLPATQARIALADIADEERLSTLPMLYNAVLVSADSESQLNPSIYGKMRSLGLAVIDYIHVVRAILFEDERIPLPKDSPVQHTVSAAACEPGSHICHIVDHQKSSSDERASPAAPSAATAVPEQHGARMYEELWVVPSTAPPRHLAEVPRVGRGKNFVKQRLPRNQIAPAAETSTTDRTYIELADDIVRQPARKISRPVSAIDAEDIIPRNVFDEQNVNPLCVTVRGRMVDDLPRSRKRNRTEVVLAQRHGSPQRGRCAFARTVSPPRPGNAMEPPANPIDDILLPPQQQQHPIAAPPREGRGFPRSAFDVSAMFSQ